MEYEGYNVMKMKKGSAIDCACACLNEDSCSFFTYNSNRKRCVMKSRRGNRKTVIGASSGSPNCCPRKGPVDGKWSEWGPWGDCRDGKKTRTRECNNPAPSVGGEYCTGFSSDTDSCPPDSKCIKINMEYEGHNVMYEKKDSAIDCACACLNEDSCSFFTYNSNRKSCVMKSRRGNRKTVIGAYSGSPNCCSRKGILISGGVGPQTSVEVFSPDYQCALPSLPYKRIGHTSNGMTLCGGVSPKIKTSHALTEKRYE